MKKYLFLLFIISLLFIAKNSTAQRTPLPTDSAQWVFSGFYHQNSDSVFIYRVKGDTILAGITYSKVYKANDTDTSYYSTNETLHCFIRNDSNRRAYVRYPITYCNDTTEILLYDYNLMPGDTFNVHLFQPQIGCIDTMFQFIVTGRNDNVEYYPNYFGTQLQLGITNSIGLGCWGYYCPEQSDNILVWNEESGTLHHMTFYNEYDHCVCCGPALYSGFLIKCFWEKGHWVTGPCVIVNTDEEQINVSEINIFPNPVMDISTITYKNNNNKLIKFELYNLLGEKLNYIMLDDALGTPITINRKNYKTGYYIGKFTDNYGNSINIKIIIL